MLHHHQGHDHPSTEYSRLPWRKASGRRNLLVPHGWLPDGPYLWSPGARLARAQVELVELNTFIRPEQIKFSDS
jgi:hypothetical protein